MQETYLTQVWKKKTGYDPVVLDWRLKFWSVVLGIGGISTTLLTVVLGTIWLFWLSSAKSPEQAMLGLLLVVLIIGIAPFCIGTYITRLSQTPIRLRRFQESVNELAENLRVEEQILDKLSQSDLTPIAIKRLTDLARYLMQIETVPDDSKEGAVEYLKGRFNSLLTEFIWWSLIEDGPVDRYFSR